LSSKKGGKNIGNEKTPGNKRLTTLNKKRKHQRIKKGGGTGSWSSSVANRKERNAENESKVTKEKGLRPPENKKRALK